MEPSNCDHNNDQCDCSITPGDAVSFLDAYGLYREGKMLPVPLGNPYHYWPRMAYRLFTMVQNLIRWTEPEHIDEKQAICCPKCRDPRVYASVNQQMHFEYNPYTQIAKPYVQAVCLACGHKCKIVMNGELTPK